MADSALTSICSLDLSSSQLPGPHLHVRSPGTSTATANPARPAPPTAFLHFRKMVPPIILLLGPELWSHPWLCLLCTPQHKSSQLFFHTSQTAAPHFQHSHSALSWHHPPTGNSVNLLAGLLPLPFPVRPTHPSSQSHPFKNRSQICHSSAPTASSLRVKATVLGSPTGSGLSSSSSTLLLVTHPSHTGLASS